MCHEILTKYINEVDSDVRPFLTSSFPDKPSYSFHRNTAETGHIVRSSSAYHCELKLKKILAHLGSFTSILTCSVSGQFLYRFHSVKLKLCK